LIKAKQGLFIRDKSILSLERITAARVQLQKKIMFVSLEELGAKAK
jgi:hypothetical protein